jgi:hypothetical protein
VTNEEAHEQIQQQKKQCQALENWAADRVRPWRGLHEDDYDFRSWAKNASKQLLRAGAIYEYARESRKLRCLLALMDPRRPRENWEMVRPGNVDGKPPDPRDPLAQAMPLPCSFEDLNEHGAEHALGGFLYCLSALADYLADNISFAELFRAKRDELDKAFGGLDRLSRVSSRFRFFRRVQPITVAIQSEAEQATVAETITADEKRIILGEPCSEVIALRFHWRFTDSEIVAAFRKFLDKHRPQNEAYKPQQGKRGSRRLSFQTSLDCLSAMRLASYLPKIAPSPSPRKLAAWQSGASPELKQSAIDVFDMIRLGGRDKPMAESNFDSLIVSARELFKKSFPFGEDAANAPTLADRIMMKSERISSQDKL